MYAQQNNFVIEILFRFFFSFLPRLLIAANSFPQFSKLRTSIVYFCLLPNVDPLSLLAHLEIRFGANRLCFIVDQLALSHDATFSYRE